MNLSQMQLFIAPCLNAVAISLAIWTGGQGEAEENDIPGPDESVEIISSAFEGTPDCTDRDWHHVYNDESWKDSERHERKENEYF